VQYGLLTIYYQGMASIVAALKTCDGIGTVCQQVNDFALAFITPLSSYQNDTFTHNYTRIIPVVLSCV